MASFKQLLQPGRIGKVQTRNRIIKTANGMFFGYGNKKNVFLYEAIARGGAGLIIVESTGVDYPLGVFSPPLFHIENDSCLPFFSGLAQSIHKYNCPAFLSLLHAGPYHSSFTNLQPVSSSAKAANEMPVGQFFKMAPRELSITEIEDLVDKFASAAVRAKQAGFDGVEFNAATFHLLNSFLSCFWNTRRDIYGCQTLESRTKFLVDIIKETRKRNGPDFPIGVLINAAEYGLKDGITPDEGVGIAKILEKAGVDSLQVRAYGFGDYFNMHMPDVLFYPEAPDPLGVPLDGSRHGAGLFIPLIEMVKKAISIPVIAIGRLDVETGEKIIREGKADFIGMARRFIADTDLPNKVSAGKTEEVRPCVACIECQRSSRNFSPVGVRCRVNAAIGSEESYELTPAARKKKVVVIGAGPAGMEVASVAAARGHEVHLYDKEPGLGGLLPLAAVVQGTDVENCNALNEYYQKQLEKLGVKITLKTETGLSQIESIKPDVVVVAAGGVARQPDIPGIDKKIVVNNAELHKTLKASLRIFGSGALSSLTKVWMPVGKRVVIIGGGIQGCELAEFLVKRDRKVTIVDTEKTLGNDLVELRKFHLFRWFTKKGVVMMPEVKYEEITDRGLEITDKEGKKQTLEAVVSIIPVLPMAPNQKLLKDLEGKVSEIYTVGDCREPHLILEAVADGFRIGKSI